MRGVPVIRAVLMATSMQQPSERQNCPRYPSRLEMGKNPKLWVRVRFRFFDDKDSVLFGF